MFAAETGENITYGRICAPLDGFVESVERFRAEGGAGLNVTVPFKAQAHAYATRHTPRAAVAGAVNTLRFETEGVLGDNTDGVGLVSDIEARMGVPLAGARVLLLGAGGAARGVIQPLLVAGAAALVVANRSPERAWALCEALGAQLPPEQAARLQGGAVEALAQSGFDVVINATSASLSDAAPTLPERVWQGPRLAVDLVYGATPTPFMQMAAAAGCPQVEDGLGMLVGQAAASFALWRGVAPDPAPVLAALRARLAGG